MDLNDLVTRFGLPLAELVVVVIAFVRGDIVAGFVYKDALAQRDRALDAAERLMSAADIATSVVERVVRPRRVRT